MGKYANEVSNMKTKQSILEQFYLSQTDIRILLSIGYKQADKLYDLANSIDEKELGEYRIEPNKVRITTVCKVTGFTLNTLQKQIKSA